MSEWIKRAVSFFLSRLLYWLGLPGYWQQVVLPERAPKWLWYLAYDLMNWPMVRSLRIEEWAGTKYVWKPEPPK